MKNSILDIVPRFDIIAKVDAIPEVQDSTLTAHEDTNLTSRQN